MSANFIGPPIRDFNQMFMLAENELAALNRDTELAADLVAICVFASQGSGYFCCSMQQYRDAINSLLRKVSVDVPEFLKRITPVTGFRRGQVPKFEYRSCHRPNASDRRYAGVIDEVGQIMLNCNWGVAQIPGWVVVAGVKPECRIKYLQAFLGDLNFQMRTLITQYGKVLAAQKGDREKALRMWFHACGFNAQADYKAARVMQLADELRDRSSRISPEYTV